MRQALGRGWWAWAAAWGLALGCQGEGAPVGEVLAEGASPVSAEVAAPRVGAAAPPAPASVPEAPPERKAAAPPDYLALHREALVVDMHVDALWFTERRGLGLDEPAASRQSQAAQLERGGVDAVFFSVWVPPEEADAPALALRLARRVEAELGPGWGVARSAAEVREIVGSGRRAALLGLEGGAALGGDPQAIDAFAALGVRYMSLTWNEANAFGAGAKARPDGGLTAAGRALVERLHRHGILVDVSHASRRTFWGLAEVSLAPLVATHSNARAVCDHPRNLDDLQLLAVAESGGVVGLNLHSPFVVRRGRATLEDIGRHAAHLRALIGASHVGLGSDFEGDIQAPADLEDHALLPLLTQELLAVGYTPEEVPQVLGGNTLRVMEEASRGELRRRIACIPVEFKSRSIEIKDGYLTTGLRLAAGEVVEVKAPPGGDQLRLWGATPWEAGGVQRVRVSGAPRGGAPWAVEVAVPPGGARLALPPGLRALQIEALEAGWLAEVSVDRCEPRSPP